MTNSNQNGNSTNRLDRIEAVLERITDRLDQVSEAGQRTDERLDRLSEGQQRTDGRLDRLSEGFQQTDARLERIGERMEQIAAAVQDERIRRAEDYNELRTAIAITNQAVETTNHRIDAFITENRANWERYERHKAENDLRFNNMLADARADRDEMRRQREANERDHEEFRAAIRSLLDR
ncbi:MAG: hypothetical protein F6J95_031235 [Leptolyngbya sp. SIO1E4]|nr:hypothetical protein [Leptolyngbya sp. SIO1E4]